MAGLTDLLRGLGPAMPHPKSIESLRAGLGATLGLFLTALVLWALQGGTADILTHPLLIAPFGASTYLIFAVPNSPLAQPWSAVIGNTVSALAAIAILHIGLPSTLAAPLAVGVAVLAMASCRAMHPPGGAVALATVLGATPDQLPDLGFALVPVAAGTVSLVLLGVLWNRATGRVYPFRQPAAPVPLPDRNASLSADLLARTLANLHLDANLGTEDLARLIEAAESEALTTRLGPITAEQLMTRGTITVGLQTPLPALAELFRQHGFKSLPVLTANNSFAGLVPQTALVGVSDASLTAENLLAAGSVTVTQSTPLADLIRLIAIVKQPVLPVVSGQTLRGLITRSDLIAVLSGHRHS